MTLTKNNMIKVVAVLAILSMITACFVGGTFAKYTTSADSEDAARVAYWGFQSSNSMDIEGLFSSEYTNVESVNGDDVIAPGTEGSTTFSFAWDESTSARGTAVGVTGPEVAYTFGVSIEEDCDSLIKENKNIQWKLDNGEWGTWDELVASLKALSGEADGEAEYAPNTLPDAFTANDDVHTISWQWLFEGTDTYTVDGNTLTQDEFDTYMGNAEVLDDCSIKIKITATQIN